MICASCPHLNKSKYMEVNDCRLYGCKANTDGYVRTWINDDSLLTEIGCEFGESKQLSIFDFMEV